MSARSWMIVACLSVGISLPVYGGSLTSSSQELLIERMQTKGSVEATTRGDGLVFRNSMKESGRGSPELIARRGDASTSAELPLDERGITSLPEPSSGVLVGMGFVLFFCFSRRKALA